MMEDIGRKEAVAALVLGVVSLIAWCLPLCGAPVTVIGLVLGVRGLQSSQRGIAIAGIALCSIGLLLTLVNAAIGAYLGATGQHPLLRQWQR